MNVEGLARIRFNPSPTLPSNGRGPEVDLVQKKQPGRRKGDRAAVEFALSSLGVAQGGPAQVAQKQVVAPLRAHPPVVIR